MKIKYYVTDASIGINDVFIGERPLDEDVFRTGIFPAPQQFFKNDLPLFKQIVADLDKLGLNVIVKYSYFSDGENVGVDIKIRIE